MAAVPRLSRFGSPYSFKVNTAEQSLVIFMYEVYPENRILR